MKRRTFLQAGLTATALPLLLNGFPVRTFASPKFETLGLLGMENDKILVLIQLSGGNDGLNTIIPLTDYSILSSARQNILIPEKSVLKLTDETGIHPSMAKVQEMYKNGMAEVIQCVGYPEPNYSHFRSTDIWTTASDSDKIISTGWLGRYLNEFHPDFPDDYPNAEYPDPLSITIGSVVSNTCQGLVTNVGMALQDLTSIYDLVSGGEDSVPDTQAGLEIAYLRNVILQTQKYTGVIKTASDKGNNVSTSYPTTGDNKLADQLKTVAKLISGGLKTKIYVVSMSGFDTHSNQVDTDTTIGDHATLLGYVSEAVYAFFDDLKQQNLDHNVAAMTFSEFGRRIISNASAGTDHGAAAPMFIFSSEVNPVIHGTNAVLPDNPGVNDNVPMQFDFRSIYWSVLRDWFGVSDDILETVLFEKFDYIQLFKTTSVDDAGNTREFLLSNYPNPFGASTNIKFSLSSYAYVNLDIFDASGRHVTSLISKTRDAGAYDLRLDASALTPGMYYAVLRANGKRSTVAMNCVK